MEWISVKDRLPKVNQDVLVCDFDGVCTVACLRPDNKWTTWADHWSSEEITYWMKLPERPIQ